MSQVIVYGIEPSNTPSADHHTRLALAGHVGALLRNTIIEVARASTNAPFVADFVASIQWTAYRGAFARFLSATHIAIGITLRTVWRGHFDDGPGPCTQEVVGAYIRAARESPDWYRRKLA